MQKKIQKIGLVLGLWMFGNAPLFVHAAETQGASPQEELPNFLPKEDKITGVIWGTWKASTLSDDSEIHPEPPTAQLDFMTMSKEFDWHNNRVSFWVDVGMHTQWELKHKPPFKLKTALDIVIQGDKGFECDGESIKLWFDNGQSLEVPSDRSKTNPCTKEDHRYFAGNRNILTQTDDDPSQAMSEYRLTGLIQSHKPVALTQGKKVVLMKSLNEKPIQEYQEMVNPKLHPDYIEAIKNYYEICLKNCNNLKWVRGEI